MEEIKEVQALENKDLKNIVGGSSLTRWMGWWHAKLFRTPNDVREASGNHLLLFM
jgi:hypothetical protein